MINMKFSDFLSLCNTIQRLFGTSLSKAFFKKHQKKYGIDIDKMTFDPL